MPLHPPTLSTPPPIVAPRVPGTAAQDAAYSIHARRRLAALLRLKYLELHEEHLEYVRRVIEQHLGAGALFAEPVTATPEPFQPSRALYRTETSPSR